MSEFSPHEKHFRTSLLLCAVTGLTIAKGDPIPDDVFYHLRSADRRTVTDPIAKASLLIQHPDLDITIPESAYGNLDRIYAIIGGVLVSEFSLMRPLVPVDPANPPHPFALP